MSDILIGEMVNTSDNDIGVFAGKDYQDSQYCYVHTNDKVRKVLLKEISRKLNHTKAIIHIASENVTEHKSDGKGFNISLDCAENYERGHMKVLSIIVGGKTTAIYMDQNGNINLSRAN